MANQDINGENTEAAAAAEAATATAWLVSDKRNERNFLVKTTTLPKAT